MKNYCLQHGIQKDDGICAFQKMRKKKYFKEKTIFYR